MDIYLNPVSANYATLVSQDRPQNNNLKQAILSSKEQRVLSLLINRLEVVKNGIASRPDMTFFEPRSSKEDKYVFGNISIHPKESDLFVLNQKFYHGYTILSINAT